VWKASLRSLSTTQDLFHAHFGPAAYRRLFRKRCRIRRRGAGNCESDSSRSAHASLRSSRSLYDRVSGVRAKVGPPTANELA
jgi:hypothetical protein